MLLGKTSSRKSFFDIFPTPEFLKMPYAGIDISDTSVKFVEFKESDGNLTLSNYGEERFSPGVVKEGEIIDAKQLIAVLSNVRKKINTDFVKVTLPEEKVYLFKTELPPEVEDEEIRDAVETHLEENVPISKNDVIFECVTLGRPPEKKDLEVLVTVYPQKIINSYVEVLHASGMSPLSFHTQGQAIAFSVIPKDKRGTFIVLNFGHTSSLVSIVKNGKVRFTSVVNIGGSSLTDAVQKYFGVSRAEAIKMKSKKYLFSAEKNNELLMPLMNAFSAMKDEINKVVIYWNGRGKIPTEEDEIKKVIMCGGDSTLFGFAKYLYLTLNIETEPGNVWTNAFSIEKNIPDMSFQESLDFAGAIGMALPFNSLK